MNLLMLSGDASVAQGQDGAFSRMLTRYAAYWSRIDVLTPNAPGASARMIGDNVHIHPSPWGKVLQPIFIWQHGRKLLAERRYDLLTSHDFGFFYNGVGAYLLTHGRDLPVVSEIHHVEGYPRAVTSRERLYRQLARWYVPFANRHVTAFRTVNLREVPELLRELGVPDEKILVLPSLYIDYAVFQPMPDVSKRFDVIFVGRLVSNKGIFTLLEAVEEVKHTHTDVTLGMLGRGDLRDAILERIAELNLTEQVTLVEYVADPREVARFYNQGKMLVCASTAEGGPRVTVEAMACRVPVISTPVGIMPELIDDGVNGLLFEWDADELAGKIRLLLDDIGLRDRIADQGYVSAENFDAEKVIASYARGYHALIERERQGWG